MIAYLKGFSKCVRMTFSFLEDLKNMGTVLLSALFQARFTPPFCLAINGDIWFMANKAWIPECCHDNIILWV